MKKYLLFLILISIFAGCTKAGCKIEGTVTGLADTKVYLGVYENRETKIIDSTTIKDGYFLFELDSIYPEMAYISFDGTKDVARLILEPGTISVVCNFDSANAFVVSGTNSNDLLSEYNREKRDPDYRARFIKDNNRSYAAAYLLSQTLTYGFSVSQVDSLLSILDPLILPNKFKDKLVARRDILAKTAPGNPAPEITMTTSFGNQLSLSSLKGSTVLIDFWASWCDTCRRENPEIVALYNKYKDRGFTVLGVSFDSKRDEWLEAISTDGLTWDQVSELKGWNSSVVDNYGIVGIPHTVLVDSTGVIAATMLFGAPLEQKIEELVQ